MTDAFPYYQPQTFHADLAGQAIQFVSKPGLPGWDNVSPGAALLADAVQAPPAGQILLLGSGHGALAAILAHRVPQGWLWAADSLASALAMTHKTLEINQVHNAQVLTSLSLAPGTCQAAAMLLPKGRKLARRWLLQAHAALAPGGAFYLAGANDEGIQAVLKDAAQLFGTAGILGYKKGHRAARMLKPHSPLPLPPWAAEPGIAPGTWHQFEIAIRGQSFMIHSLPGVFSYDQLDEGTALLLETLAIPQGVDVLDIGCGCGIIGMYASRLGAGRVDLVDNNLLAIEATQENLLRNQIPAAQALAGDLLELVAGRQYDLVLSNPPFHTGKEVDYQVAHTLIAHAHQVLKPGGLLTLVANRFIRYDRLMAQIFGSVQAVKETGRFHVLTSQK